MRVKKWIGVLTVTSMLLTGCATANKTATNTTNTSSQPVGTEQKQVADESYNKVKDLEKVQAKVKRVVDGDTLVAEVKGTEKKVRMLLLDTPESVKPNEKPMKYGKEASDYTKKLLEGKSVELVYDKGEKEDHYHRQLAYVFLDGKCVEADILKQGLGVVRYIKTPNTTLYDELKKVQEEAKKDKKGVWSINGYVLEKGKETLYSDSIK
ncbi:thermonuclease family protein [Bacillus sp. FSL R9-9410]|uniref:thermonuclease family protein n=1 Tax=Bacillus sp. FSL R9-9410 TaxID=2921590 RepID=UPI003100BD02